MKSNFHYSVIKILATKAGFSEEEAQIIAYASQYVDDADDYIPVRIQHIPDFAKTHVRCLDGKHIWDPICTAHKSIKILPKLFKTDLIKVYSAFHFLPNKRCDINARINGKELITFRNGELANQLVLNCAEAVQNATPSQRNPALIALGIALHSYADTWAHQGFSGIHSEFNDIKNVRAYNKHWWYGFLPDIGHAEASDYPDRPYLKWSYQYDGVENISSSHTERNNPQIFADAVYHIYSYLLMANKTVGEPDKLTEISNQFKTCFKSMENDTSAFGEQTYKKLLNADNLYYSETLWFHDSQTNYSDLWFWFHIKAFEQRNTILGSFSEKHGV